MGQNNIIYEILSFAQGKLNDNGAFWNEIRNSKWHPIDKIEWLSKKNLNLSLKYEHFKFEIVHEMKKTSLKKIQTNYLLNNVAAIKYVIFLQISLEYIIYISQCYKSLRAFHCSIIIHKLKILQFLSTNIILFRSEWKKNLR